MDVDLQECHRATFSYLKKEKWKLVNRSTLENPFETVLCNFLVFSTLCGSFNTDFQSRFSHRINQNVFFNGLQEPFFLADL